MLSSLLELISSGFELYTDKGELHPDEGRRIFIGFDNLASSLQNTESGACSYLPLEGTSFSDLQNFTGYKNTLGDKISTLLCCPLYSPALKPINIFVNTWYFHANYRTKTTAGWLVYPHLSREHSKEMVPGEWINILAQINVRQGRIISGMILWDGDERHEFWVLGWRYTPSKPLKPSDVNLC